MSLDTAQDIEEEDDTLVNLVKTSVANKLRKRKSMAEIRTARREKKVAGIGPFKSWSKVEVRKRKESESSESGEDVEYDVSDIPPVKRKSVKKSPNKVAAVHFDNISFHVEDGAAKWKFVTQRRVAVERELGKEASEVKEVMELIKAAGLMKTQGGLQGFVRGKCVKLSPTTINKFLGRGTDGGVDLETTDNEVCRIITAGQVKEWPSRKHLSTSKLTVKYAILHKIGSANWIPTNHVSTISIILGRIIHAIGTKINYDFGKFIFDQTIRHASTNVVKLPIAFPSIMCGIILSQQPGILNTNDMPSRRKTPLSIHYKLFEGSHINDVVMTSVRREPASQGSLIDQLKDTCKELEKGMKVAKARKEALEALICSLEKEEIEKAGKDSDGKAQSSGSSGSSEGSEDEDECEGDTSSSD
ncbi:hypothetical protein KIW84_063315 [Lathyrus oleraceus]|uniref:Putative plant transposon protein domain-containing protein n=1 Tax=Pisum sativum TaxID=3888 RepID=A0A9D4WAV8_PEA|nr:hypothetical protein KIW84_063315 [Pisum sativum]